MPLKLTKDEMSRLPEWAIKQIESQTKCDKKTCCYYAIKINKR